MFVIPTTDPAQKAQFEQWMHDYETDILRICYLYLGNRVLAEDAMQDTFFKAWRNMKQFKFRSSVKTWLTRIAVNTCRDYIRSAWWRREQPASDSEIEVRQVTTVSSESQELFFEVMRLPSKYREVIVLRYYQNITTKETAAILGISRMTLARRLKKAYLLLRQQLDGGYEHDK